MNDSTEAEANILHMTHLSLVLFSHQAPHTMPSMSSTPRAPATTPLRNRPTAVALLESELARQQSFLSACGRVTVTVQVEIMTAAVIIFCENH